MLPVEIVGQSIFQPHGHPYATSESKRKQHNMENMNYTSGWMGGGMWLWTVIGIAVVVLLVIVVINQKKK